VISAPLTYISFPASSTTGPLVAVILAILCTVVVSVPFGAIFTVVNVSFMILPSFEVTRTEEPSIVPELFTISPVASNWTVPPDFIVPN